MDQWYWTPQPCGRPDDHHIGFLWNAEKVTLSRLDSLWQFNAKAHSSKKSLQRGSSARALCLGAIAVKRMG